MSAKITAIPIVEFGASNARKSTWIASENPVFSRKSKVVVGGISGRSRGSFWQRNKRIIVPSVIVVAVVVAVAAGVGVSRSASQAAENAAAASGSGTGLTGGEASAAPTPLADPSLLAPSPAVVVPSASASGSVSASAAASVSSTVSATATSSSSSSSTAAPSASQSITASATPSPTALPLPSTIAVSFNASSVELWSARMLSERLGFPLTYWRIDSAASATPVASAVIAVGYAAAVRAGVSAQQLDSLSKDGVLLTNRRERGLQGGSLAVSSGPAPTARGTLYGAYRLLKVLGFGFFSTGVNGTRIPPLPFKLPSPYGIDIVEQPPLTLRDATMLPVQDNRNRIRGANGSITYPPVNISAALGFNGASVSLPVGAFEGVNLEPPGFVHTSVALLTPTLIRDATIVAATNPAFIACFNVSSQATVQWPCWNATLAAIDNNVQPCWSLPAAQAFMVQNIRAIMAARPSVRVLEIDVMDGNPPICPMDAAVNALENYTGGAYLRAVNAIAAALEPEFPQLRIQSIAYNDAQAPPPNFTMRDNVMIRYVTGGLDQFSSLHAPSNARILREAQTWLTKARSVTVWDNCENFKFLMAPWPNYFTLPQHVIEFARIGYTGYYAAGWSLQGADMAELKTHLVAAAMWDPFNVNLTAVAQEYALFTYGSPAAAAGVLGYMAAMQASFRDNDRTLDYKGYKNVRGASRRITLWNAVYSNRTMIACGQLLKDAEAAAPTPWHKDNVRQVMLPVQYITLLRWGQLRLHATATNTPWPFSATAAEEFALFNTTFTRTKVFSVTMMDEYPAISEFSCDLKCLRLLMLGY